MRVVILGTYNSGSSIVSEIMETLGFHLGRPLWGDHFESLALRNELVKWWSEPRLIESAPEAQRIAFLRAWVERCEEVNPMVCAKHPLLCLSAWDLDKAWGDDYRVIRASRSFEASVKGLERRQWFPNPRRMQEILSIACEEFTSQRPCFSMDYEKLVSDPAERIAALAGFLGLKCQDDAISKAATLVRTA